MKTVSKIISVVLALVLALSVFMLPATAADKGVDINARVTATQVGEDANGLKIYKMGVYVNSSHSLVAVQMNLTYDNSALQLLRPNHANATVVNANMVIDKADTELAMYDGDAYTAYEGVYTDGDVNPKYGYAMFPQDGTQPTLAKISDTNMGAELKGEGYTGLYWQWMVDFTDNYLLLSGGTQKTKALNGEVKLLTFYMKEKAGAANGSYEVGFNAKQAYRLTGTYSTVDAVDSVIVGPEMASITPAMVSYENATITIGEEAAAPTLTKSSAQVKMTPNSATTVEDAFQFRVVSKISDADWNTYFANTGVADATTNAITSVGFVAYKGTEGFSLDTAKAVAAGTAADGYSVATTDYIQHTDGADAQFGCRLEITSAETRSDVTYVAFAQYVDASGAAQVVFYDAAYEALLATNYTGIVASYLAAFPFAG